MKSEQAIDIMKEFLNDYLKDPISNRKTNWIYDDEVRADLSNNSLPRIVINRLPLRKTQVGIGNFNTLDVLPIEIIIKSNVGRKYAYNSTTFSGEDFIAEVGANIEILIKQNHSYFVEKGFISLLCTGERQDKDFEKNPIFVLSLDLTFIN